MPQTLMTNKMLPGAISFHGGMFEKRQALLLRA